MKGKILLTATGTIAALLLLGQALTLFDQPAYASVPLDLAAVDRIDISGSASRIRVTADPARRFEARLTAERSGWGVWRSLWYDPTCRPETALSVANGTATIDTGPSTDLLGWDECLPTLTANIRPGTALKIDQQAAKIELAGDFLSVDVNAAAGDMQLDGHAERLTLTGAALRARLVFDTVRNSETIRLLGTMMQANLVFPLGTAVSYLVETTASYVDSQLPNTPGAKPEIEIRGSMVHATIR
ncbi:hypothetical protein ACLE20_10315 [Rhizobium sp. YIM 134829]|uniref:hypothetical protein n=1 Tax=Rhizobium sp. YIM 134829 TaxID=3390453 RepID=UPI00397DC487